MNETYSSINRASPLLPITLVVVNYNSSSDLIDMVSGLPIERLAGVVVVDNASEEEELELLRRYVSGTSGITLIESNYNRGFGAAVNLGVENCHAAPESLIWILNPDMSVSETALDAMYLAAEASPQAIFSPVIETGFDSKKEIWFAGGTLDRERGSTFHWKEINRPPHDRANLSFVTGAAMMMSVAVWRKVGGFRPDLFLYWEDAEFCVRAVEVGVVLAVNQDARIWHRVGGSGAREGKSRAYYFYMQRNRIRVCAKYTSRRSLVLGAGFPACMRLVARPLLREKSDRFGKSIASLRGVLCGILEL